MPELQTSYRKFIFFGPQGSGKGTQATLVAQTLGIPRIPTGEIYRKNIADGTALGQLAARYIQKGNLVPDAVTNELMAKRLKETDAKNGFILDGYPRNRNQDEALEKMTDIDVVLEIGISDEEAIRRIAGRLECTQCGTIFNIYTNPPKNENVCDRCGGKLVQREDDKEEAVKRRLTIYHSETEPLFEDYRKLGKLITINGEQAIAAVTREIVHKLNDYHQVSS